ncbi:zinc ribbon domain-containing protein [Streptomyces sp. NPDC001177]
MHSQRCSACGFVTAGYRESQVVFLCKAAGCGHRTHADVNAAINIKHAAGYAVSVCGDLGVSPSAKQEPYAGRLAQPLSQGTFQASAREKVK